MRGGIVYKATHLASGKVYVGATTRSLGARKFQHYHYAAQTPFTKFLRSLPECEFEWEVIEECSDHKALKRRERAIIKEHKNNCFNIQHAVDGKYYFIHVRTTTAIKDALQKVAKSNKTTLSNYGHKILAKALAGDPS